MVNAILPDKPVLPPWYLYILIRQGYHIQFTSIIQLL